MNWYVKNPDGKVFGPADDAKILEWVKDGRVDPYSGVSNDLKSWKLASLEPSFEMDWIVENEPGRFYGPTNREVVEGFLKSGSLSKQCRIYRDDHGGAAERDAAAARVEAEKAMAEVQSEAEKAMHELKSEAERALQAKDSEIDGLKAEIAELKELAGKSARREAELAEKIAALTADKKREWKTETIEPEIVSEEAPPAIGDVFTSGRNRTLADLERQAQAELARMGASGAKSFFGIKK